jgi:hypothetical protein
MQSDFIRTIQSYDCRTLTTTDGYFFEVGMDGVKVIHYHENPNGPHFADIYFETDLTARKFNIKDVTWDQTKQITQDQPKDSNGDILEEGEKVMGVYINSGPDPYTITNHPTQGWSLKAEDGDVRPIRAFCSVYKFKGAN